MIVNYVYGLGGRDTSPKQIQGIFEDLVQMANTKKAGELVRFVGLRE
jgi:pyruvate/2-oxoacid:ferredoxin oxidoreductase alpha subunit